MITGGNATVYVSNMDNAVRFYTEVLGLKLTDRFGSHFATVQAGTTLRIYVGDWDPDSTDAREPQATVGSTTS
jgi:catechol 2,3-dioxygenase-like lactoylglutathione lyase family enzyme